MPPPSKKTAPPRVAPAPEPVPTPVPSAPVEMGWLADCVYTGEKFEVGLAFFVDAAGRITRFSREPADLAIARRLTGQAVLPGLVNAHSHAFHRVLRGRFEPRPRPERDGWAGWCEAHDRVAARIGGEDVFDVARMVFLEMLLSGITCVGEFHYLHRAPEGAPESDANAMAEEILRAAHDVGIRIALLRVAWTRATPGETARAAHPRMLTATAEEFLRDTEALRATIGKKYLADDAWLGVGVQNVAAVPLEYLKPIVGYAHAKRMRVHMHVSARVEENQACVAEHGRTPIALLAENGIVDKRFTAIHAGHLTDEEVKTLGAARAIVCACPTTERNLGFMVAAADQLVAAGAGIALGTDSHVQIDLLEEARAVEYALRGVRERRAVFSPEGAVALFRAATTTGARSLGATTGALEVGRPADFFTVNLFDPTIAGAEPGALLSAILFSLQRRAIREVWIGARQRIANGRHLNQGPIVGRFADLQRRLWPGV
ncbi:MAG: formimidoylglutamate deiminase [Opitutaceae bacterium]